jgi:exodeoxyribonuclease VII large subunit
VRHYDARRILAGIAKELTAREAAMAAAMRTVLLQQRSRLEQFSAQITALSPLAILERGYALVFDATGKLLKNAAQVRPGDDISARLAQGTLTATVKNGKEK